MPHIGEYAAKTNARERPLRGAAGRSAGSLLPVVLQHLVAGRRYLRAVLLEAGEDREIALVDHLAAVLLHVAGACRLLCRGAAPLLLGEGSGRGDGERQQVSARRDLRIVILHFDGRNPDPRHRVGTTGRIFGIAGAA